jgi:hypothetical protein
MSIRLSTAREEAQVIPRLLIQHRAGPPSKGRKRKCKKDVKIEGTNPISPLKSAKVSKNELKTNWS